MARYGGYTDPADYYQGTAFDPMTGRLQGGQMVMQVLNQIAANKRKKKEEGWEVEDRELNRRFKEAQMSNLYETVAPKAPAQKGYQLPPNVKKQVAQYHGFKDETEYDAYDPQMQQTMFNEYLDAQQELTKAGLKIKPSKTASAKLKSISDALSVIKDRATQLGAEYRGLINNPFAAQYLGGDPQAVMADYKKRLASLTRARYRIASFARQMGDDGSLPPKIEDELRLYLDMPESLEQGSIFGSDNPARPRPPVGTEQIPPDVLAAAKKARPDLTEQEIINAWKARKR